VNFAAHGDPNGEGLPRWPAYRDEQRDRVEVGASRLDSVKVAFLEKYDAAAMSK
jgi:carboxylesterase type B